MEENVNENELEKIQRENEELKARLKMLENFENIHMPAIYF